MAKITVKNPVVKVDGARMARIIWPDINHRLILPFPEIDLKHFDLSMHHLDLPAQAQGGQPRPA